MTNAYFDTESPEAFIELCVGSDVVTTAAQVMSQQGFAEGVPNRGMAAEYFGHLNELSEKMEGFIDLATNIYGPTDAASSAINSVRGSVFRELPGLKREVSDEEVRVDEALRETARAFNVLCSEIEATPHGRALYNAEKRNLAARIRELELLGNTSYWPFLQPTLRDRMMTAYEMVVPTEEGNGIGIDAQDSEEVEPEQDPSEPQAPQPFRVARLLGYTIIRTPRSR